MGLFFFWAEEAQVIMGIPLSKFSREDKLAWSLTENGTFAVKSAYSLAIELKESSKGAASYGLQEEARMWNSIWKLPV